MALSRILISKRFKIYDSPCEIGSAEAEISQGKDLRRILRLNA